MQDGQTKNKVKKNCGLSWMQVRAHQHGPLPVRGRSVRLRLRGRQQPDLRRFVGIHGLQSRYELFSDFFFFFEPSRSISPLLLCPARDERVSVYHIACLYLVADRRIACAANFLPQTATRINCVWGGAIVPLPACRLMMMRKISPETRRRCLRRWHLPDELQDL